MKRGGRNDAVGWQMPTEKEVQVAGILLNLQESFKRPKIDFNWGRKKKRSVLESESESESESELSPPERSPSTPLCLLPNNDGGEKGKTASSAMIIWKKKTTEDLMEVYKKVQLEKENIKKKLKAVETFHQELTYENLEIKTTGQKINYPRSMEHYHVWNSSMKTMEQQHCPHQLTMFAPSTSKSVVDPNNGKVATTSCSSNNNSGGGLGLFNEIDLRVKIHGEYYDFMGSSQPLDRSKFLMMDSDLRVKAAAAARMRRKLRMKEVKNSLAMKLSRSGFSSTHNTNTHSDRLLLQVASYCRHPHQINHWVHIPWPHIQLPEALQNPNFVPWFQLLSYLKPLIDD